MSNASPGMPACRYGRILASSLKALRLALCLVLTLMLFCAWRLGLEARDGDILSVWFEIFPIPLATGLLSSDTAANPPGGTLDVIEGQPGAYGGRGAGAHGG